MLLTTLLTTALAGTLAADLGGETPGLSDDDVVVYAYDRAPIHADVAASLYVQIEDDPVSCQMAVNVRPTGEIAHVSGIDCPDSLLTSARDGLLSWGFHPPTQGEHAVSATHAVTLEFRARQVATAVVSADDFVIVPVAPAAIPRWPVSPEETRAAQRAVDRMGQDQIRCTFGVQLNAGGGLDELQVLDCPPSLGAQVERHARRWGFDVRGESIAAVDGRFRMEMVFESSD